MYNLFYIIRSTQLNPYVEYLHTTSCVHCSYFVIRGMFNIMCNGLYNLHCSLLCAVVLLLCAVEVVSDTVA